MNPLQTQMDELLAELRALDKELRSTDDISRSREIRSEMTTKRHALARLHVQANKVKSS